MFGFTWVELKYSPSPPFKSILSKQVARHVDYMIFVELSRRNRVFSYDVTAVILVSQNNETAAMLVYQTNPVGVELFSYVNNFFFSSKCGVM